MAGEAPNKSNRLFHALVLAGFIFPVFTWWMLSKSPMGEGTTKVPDDLKGTLLPAPYPLADFDLIDHHGNPFTLKQFSGNWSFLFFGYLSCPDVCPATLSTLQAVMHQLEKEHPKIPLPQVVFVSVDPKKDTPEKMKPYVEYFHPNFIGVTGEEEPLNAFMKQLGILAMEAENKDGIVEMQHTTSVLLINPQGGLTALFATPHEVDRITTHFSIIQEIR